VKGAGNVFFNVNTTNFKVNYNPLVPISPNSASTVVLPVNEINVFPVPASDELHITATMATTASVYNTLGQLIWSGNVDGSAAVTVAGWARGMYYVRFTDAANGAQTVKPFVVK
jgi:hypothetical protein